MASLIQLCIVCWIYPTTFISPKRRPNRFTYIPKWTMCDECAERMIGTESHKYVVERIDYGQSD